MTIAYGLLVLGITDEASAIQTRPCRRAVHGPRRRGRGLTFGAAIASIGRLLELVRRRHLQAVLRRDALMRPSATSGDGSAGAPDVAIGFADLVGFTARSQPLSESA